MKWATVFRTFLKCKVSSIYELTFTCVIARYFCPFAKKFLLPAMIWEITAPFTPPVCMTNIIAKLMFPIKCTITAFMTQFLSWITGTCNMTNVKTNRKWWLLVKLNLKIFYFIKTNDVPSKFLHILLFFKLSTEIPFSDVYYDSFLQFIIIL